MKKWISILIFTAIITNVWAQKDIDRKVDRIMSKMTLEDKCGEMTQLTLDMLAVGEPYNIPDPFTFDDDKMNNVLNTLKVGSILNVAGHAFTVEEWRNIITSIQEVAMKEKKSKIPVLYGIDAIHGNNYTVGATLFPQEINLAATWNKKHALNTGIVTGYEARASYIPWSFSPDFDIARDARWPRFWETFGEDPYLSGELGSAMVTGMQGENVNDPYKVAACMKHFLAYSQTIRGKDRVPAWIPERFIKEYFTPSFKAAIDAGAKTIMINSGEINGIPTHVDSKILIDLLRDELGFEGVAVTDWSDIIYLYTRHNVAKDHKDAIRMSINAGIDMSMVPTDIEFPTLLKELVEEGKVPMSRIDESVRRIIKLKVELGLFDNPYYEKVKYDKFASEEFRLMSLEAATESLVLLKNENNILPISKDKKVFITGPTANSLNYLNGGWTGVWQGNNEKYNTPGKQTIKEAFELEAGKNNILYSEGVSYDQDVNFKEALIKAEQSDVIMVCVGEMTYTETPGNINDINLPRIQNDYVKALSATGKDIILVYVGGRPRIIREMVPESEAIIAAMLPGNEGGHALANIIYGKENPSGKLPFTYPRYANDLVTYDYKGTDKIAADFSTNGVNPQFEFGFGLSYTTFEYSNLTIDKNTYEKSDNILVSVTVTNSGTIDGKEAIPVFVTDKIASITPSAKRLRAFDKIELKAGESKIVSFEIPVQRLAFVGRENTWIVEAGDFNIQIANLNKDFVVE